MSYVSVQFHHNLIPYLKIEAPHEEFQVRWRDSTSRTYRVELIIRDRSATTHSNAVCLDGNALLAWETSAPCCSIFGPRTSNFCRSVADATAPWYVGQIAIATISNAKQMRSTTLGDHGRACDRRTCYYLFRSYRCPMKFSSISSFTCRATRSQSWPACQHVDSSTI